LQGKFHCQLMATAGFVANGGQGIAALILVPRQLAGTAIGLSTLVGEICAGAIVPVISGAVADRHGPAALLCIAALGALTVFCAGLFMGETAPSKVPC
jgi:fucose permease